MSTLAFSLGVKFKKEDFMNGVEMIEFKKLRASGAVSIFQIKICDCEECREEIPKSKKFCSLNCKRKNEGIEENGYR